VLTRVIRNIKTFVANPSVARDYLLYWGSRLENSGHAVRTFPGGIRITDLCNFSEFHSIGSFVSDEEREFLSKYPIGQGAIIDVGANLGIVSLMLGKRFPQRSIHSFEPAPSTFQAFRTNIAFNGCNNVRAVQCAIADSAGEILFKTDPIGRATNCIALFAGDEALKVRCTTLDAYAEQHSIEEIAFLKVDVEGFEATVFQGAYRILNEQRAAIIYYEVCPGNAENSGIDPELPTRILTQHGYALHRLIRGGLLEPVDVSQVGRTILENWVAVRQ
jgi:FkbM family methyltransferase